MSNQISIAILAVILFSLIFVYNTYAFDASGKPTCKNYVFNTFTYVALMVTITSILCVIFKNTLGYKTITSLASVIAIFLMSLGSMLGIYLLPKELQYAKYFLTITFCASFAIIIAGLWSYNLVDAHTLFTVLCAALSLSAAVCTLAYKFPEYITQKFMIFSILTALLFFCIEFIVYVFASPSKKYTQIFTILGIFISLLVLVVRTKEILLNEKNCVVPDYPREGVGICVYIQDIFMRLLELKNKHK